jgi:hypothetical protein
MQVILKMHDEHIFKLLAIFFQLLRATTILALAVRITFATHFATFFALAAATTHAMAMTIESSGLRGHSWRHQPRRRQSQWRGGGANLCVFQAQHG